MKVNDIDYMIKMTSVYSEKLKKQYIVKHRIADVTDHEATKLNLVDLCESLLDNAQK